MIYSKNIFLVVVLLTLSTFVFGAERNLQPNQLRMNIPEDMNDTIDPTKLRMIDEEWFNQEIFPQIKDLKF